MIGGSFGRAEAQFNESIMRYCEILLGHLNELYRAEGTNDIDYDYHLSVISHHLK